MLLQMANFHSFYGCMVFHHTRACTHTHRRMLSRLSRVWLCATLWMAAPQALLSMGFCQEIIMEWIVVPSSRGSFWPRNLICISYIHLHWQGGVGFTTSATWKAYTLTHIDVCVCVNICRYIYIYICIYTYTYLSVHLLMDS